MSYRALLFCPDETAARPVTQVLSELDFTVELSFEPLVTVKKLTDESFDAIVVDCGNEENATLLFKGARNSNLNHSSLCVAVVEGQMGVAKAFRIGANLVLTKPINLEQSKGTLRVARGLLRKGELNPRPAGAGSVANTTTPPWPSVPAPHTAAASEPMPAGIAHSEPAAAANPVSVPSSLFEAEQVKPHGHEQEKSKPSDLAPAAPAARRVAEPTPFPAAIPTGAAAAPARALEPGTAQHSESHESRQIRTAAPLATQEAIIPETRFPEPASAPAGVPAFSSFSTSVPSSSGTSWALWVIAALVVLGPASYFGWRKFQPMRYIHRPISATVNAPAMPASPAATPSADGSGVNSTAAEQQNSSGAAPVVSAPDNLPITTNAAPEGFPTKENIDVDQPIDTPEPKITVVPKPEPLQVNQEPEEPAHTTAPPTPPSLVLPGSKASDAALAGIVSNNVIVPKPAPHALQISEGVIQGLLIKKVPPVYSPAAMQLRKQGDVQLLATVSKTGSITQIRVLSGDTILAKSAVDAVRQWKYRPFLLNAEPVEIQTQITIKFKLPN